MARRKTGGGKAHRFGGDWTTEKLDVLKKYLASYTTALKDKPTKDRPFRKAYIDAFAGTGYRDAKRDDLEGEAAQALLLPDHAEQEQALLDGSARLALKTEPRFDRYVFIERSAAHCAHLEALKLEFPDLAADIQIRREDANTAIQDLCAKDWPSHRAVLFLDPYGMQWGGKNKKAHAHEVPDLVREGSEHQRDPDRRIVAMLGARGKGVAKVEGHEVETRMIS